MGYSFTIGKKVTDEDYYKDLVKELIEEENYTKEEAEVEASRIAVKALEEEHSKAPAFGEPTDNMNERWPSYSAWSYMIEMTELERLLLNGNEVKGGHPGYFKITAEWLEELLFMIKRFKKRYPDCIASYDESLETHSVKIQSKRDREITISVNFLLCRLEWMEYWCVYAFEKYGEEAIFQNTEIY